MNAKQLAELYANSRNMTYEEKNEDTIFHITAWLPEDEKKLIGSGNSPREAMQVLVTKLLDA